MITGKLKSQIDQLWEKFWTGGIANPLTVIEQISYLMFARMLDIAESREEKKAARLGTEFKRTFPADKQHLRWGHFSNCAPDAMFPLVRDELFAFLKDEIGAKGIGQYLKDAQFLIPKPSLLAEAVSMISALPLQSGDTKGDLYEYLLGKLTTAGINGQFRTPRHVIAAMTDMLSPRPDQTVCDPACGTGGFLIAVMDYLRRTHSSPDQIHPETDAGQPLLDEHGQPVMLYPGDQLDPYMDHIRNAMFTGFDFDATMLRIAAMNLILHGIDNPQIHYQDTLAHSFSEHFPTKAENAFDIILANPPFKGSLDADDVHASLRRQVKTKKTELLFLALMVRLLKIGGRCAVIVPDGVLFGSSKAHRGIRKMLVDENQLEGVISLPSGVFKPYAGVSTAILIFTKGDTTAEVWFYDVQADGYSLDDKRNPIAADDLPDMLEQWHRRDPDEDLPRTGPAFWVPVAEIRDNHYDLSLNRYKKIEYNEVTYESPTTILDRLDALETEIQSELCELRKMLKKNEEPLANTPQVAEAST
jgi:type I restriction enzyme M protein